MNDIYNKKFELHLIKKGFDLNEISLTESLKELKKYVAKQKQK